MVQDVEADDTPRSEADNQQETAKAIRWVTIGLGEKDYFAAG